MGGTNNDREREIRIHDISSSLQKSESIDGQETRGTETANQTKELPPIRVAPKTRVSRNRHFGPKVGGLVQSRLLNQTPFDGYDDVRVTHMIINCTTEDLNDCTDENSEYYGKAGNLVNNKPNGVDEFGMRVLKLGETSCCQELTDKITGNLFRRILNGEDRTEWFTFYSTGNKPNPEDIKGALKLSTHSTQIDDRYIVKSEIDPLPVLDPLDLTLN